MSFLCPECNRKTLKIIERIELAPDVRSDEITLQVIRCKNCNFQGLAVYEESRRGVLDSESIDHYGYKPEVKDLKAIRSLIRRCPDPSNPWCSCDSHLKLNESDGSGRWVRPGWKPDQNTFTMDL
jgi:hypothetical protein